MKKRDRLKRHANGVLRVIPRAVTQFYRDGGTYMAASISFYALTSLVPLIFILINVFGYFLGRSPNLQKAIINYVKVLYPMLGATLTREIARIASHSDPGWLSIIVFMWLASLVFTSIEYSMNTIFRTEKRRHFVVATVLSFSLIVLSGLLMVASFWISYIPKFLAHHQNVITQSDVVQYMTRSVVIQVMPLFLMFLAFTSLYKLLPRRNIPLKYAAAGGAAAAILWETAKYAFSWYIGNVVDMGNVYGSLTAIIIFLLWIYYSSVVLLLVAESVFLMQRDKISLN